MAKLICTDGPNLRDEWEVRLGTTTIGRQGSNNVVLHDPKVSRHHVVIKFEDDKYSVEDLDSRNGTYVFGKKVTRVTVAPETPICVGNTTLLLTRKSQRDTGLKHVEEVGEELFIKH